MTPATLAATTIPSPLGPLWLLATDESLAAIRLPESRKWDAGPFREGSEAVRAVDLDDQPVLRRAGRELEAYFAGDLRAFSIPVALSGTPFAGTPFQQKVWRGLLAIPYGETRSYGRLAEEIGRAGASQAVGAANGRNPLPIVVPCHRVVGADGSLVGYGGGLEAKRWLLDHEAAQGDLFAEE